MFQILDIGNTHTRIAIWENGKFTSIKVVDTATLDCCNFSSIPTVAACVSAEVRKKLENCGIDSNEYSGLAFGIGIERTAMLKYGINNIKHLFESDIKVLGQLNDK